MSGNFAQTTFAGGRQAAPGGGGGGVTGAESGTFLSGANVRLGSNAGAKPLLANTDIDLNNFLYKLQQAGSDLFTIDPVNLAFHWGDINTLVHGTKISITDANRLIEMDINGAPVFFFTLGSYSMGDLTGAANNNWIEINDSTKVIKLWQGGTPHLFFDDNVKTYSIGDTINSNGRTKLFLDDPAFTGRLQAQIFYIGDFENVVSNTYLKINTPAPSLAFTSAGKGFLLLDIPNRIYAMGDINVAANGSYTRIEDANKKFEFIVNGDSLIIADKSVRFYGMGEQGLGLGNMQIDNLNGIIEFGVTNVTSLFMDTASFITYMRLNNTTFFRSIDATKKTEIGDVASVNNSTLLQVDDSGARQIKLFALNGLKITGDTTLLHTGTPLADGAGASLGTLTTAPSAGNPTKWIPIDDNGTTRFIPAW